MGKHTRYHISEDGTPRPCVAVHKCRLGNDDAHFNSFEEAREAYERNMDAASLYSGVAKQSNKNPMSAPVLNKNFGLNQDRSELVATQKARGAYATSEQRKELHSAFNSAGVKELMRDLFA